MASVHSATHNPKSLIRRRMLWPLVPHKYEFNSKFPFA
jgi:hypothetical protein